MGQPKFPKFDCIWAVCMQEETRLAAGGKLHGTQNEESQALTSVVKKGKCMGRKFYNRKDKGGRSSHITKNKRRKRIFHTFNASNVINTNIIVDNVMIQRRGNTKP